MVRKDFPRRRRMAASAPAALIAGLALAAVPAARGATGTTPAGTVISALVSVTYQPAAGGAAQIVTSNLASVTVTAPAIPTRTAQIAGLSLTPSSGALRIGRPTRTVYRVTLRNTGSGPDTFTWALTQPSGWSAALVGDTFGDGTLHATGNKPAPSLISLTAGQSQSFLLVVTPPALVLKAASATVALKVTSRTDTTKSAQSTVTTTTAAGTFAG